VKDYTALGARSSTGAEPFSAL